MCKFKFISILFIFLILFSVVSVVCAADITVIYPWSGGDISKNKNIYNQISKTSLSKQIFKIAKKGTPMITIGGGSGPKVLIVAGIHGNELSSQIAAMKMANYLNNRKINGMVYIIPFAAPYATQRNVRFYKGRNLNSNANKKGSIGYKIVSIAKKNKIIALGDFHCTKPGGFPGANAIFSSKSPQYKSYKIALYMSKKTKYKSISYKYAGVIYKGAVEDYANLRGISSITAEVKTRHGKVASGSVTRSYRQMWYFLRYNKVI